MASGKLTVMGTPIGNLGDASPRLGAALQAVGLLACEDTRRTGQLLNLLGIKAPKLISYHKDNEAQRAVELVKRLLAGEEIGLVSDSGLPGISDPGARLVAAARAAGVRVEVIPGPSAVALAVAGSGFEGGFTFIGFLPRTGKARREKLAALARIPQTVVLYEAPNRVADTCSEMVAVWGNRPAWLARELTKLHEEWLGPDLQGIVAALAERGAVKGECTLVIGGALETAETGREVADTEIVQRLTAGERTRDVADWLAVETGESARVAYQRVLALKP